MEPPLALSRLGLPEEALNTLKSGNLLSARVVKPLGGGKFLLNVSGAQVTVESRLELGAGQQLNLAAREVGTRILLDLVRSTGGTAAQDGSSAPLARGSEANISDAARAAQSSSAQPRPAAAEAAVEASSARTAPGSVARTVQGEAQVLLAKSPPLGEIVSEVRRILSAPASQPESPQHQAPPPAHGAATTPASAGQETPPGPVPATASGASQQVPEAIQQETRSSAPPPLAAAQGEAVSRNEVPETAQTEAPRPAPLVEPTTQPAPATSAPATELVPRELVQLLESLILALPATAEDQAPAQLLESLPAAMRQLLSASPERLMQLLAQVESQIAETLSALPEAARLEVLIEALDRLPLPPAPSGTEEPAAPPPQEAAQPARNLAAEVDRLLDLVPERAGDSAQRPELPAEVRSALAQLDPRERSQLREALTTRENALLQSSPKVQRLSQAHRALLNAAGRLASGRAGGLASSPPGATFSYVEVPAFDGSESTTARLRVMVRRDGAEDGSAGAGSSAGGRSKGPMRAVMDLKLSGLGEVWSELVLSREDLAVRIQLPDAATRDLVVEDLPALEERLEARGFRAQVTAEARANERPEWALSLWPDATDARGVDLWA